MERNCVRCGKPYQARSARSRYCGSTCRARASESKVTDLPKVTDGDGPAVKAARAALAAADRLDTPAAAAALALGALLDAGLPSGAASVAKEYRAAVAEALAGVAPATDLVDELRARREQRFRGA